MNIIIHAIVAVAAVGFLSHCKPKVDTSESKLESGKSFSTRNREKSATKSDSSDQGEGTNYKDTRGLAMNRNEATTSFLTRAKPDWLSIGAPIVAEESPSNDESQNWKGMEQATITKSSPDTVSEVGGLKIPNALASIQWLSASFDSERGRLLMNPLDMAEPACLFKIKNGEILMDSREEVPSINYDDKRRWYIRWESWVSDSEIVGVFNEDDFSGHTTVRAGIYLYNVASRELRRVDLPNGFITGIDPSIEIVAVSPAGLVLNTTDGEKVVSLKR